MQETEILATPLVSVCICENIYIRSVRKMPILSYSLNISFRAIIVSAQHSNQLLILICLAMPFFSQLFGDHKIFSYNAHIIRSDQPFQLLGQLTIAAGLLDIATKIPYW